MLEISREDFFKAVKASICIFLGYVGMAISQGLHLRTQSALVQFGHASRDG